MVDSLASTVERLRLNDSQRLNKSVIDERIEEEENGIYNGYRPRKRIRHGKEDVKAELEREFLTPSPTFSPDWLNRLQKLVLLFFFFFFFFCFFFWR